MSYFDYLKLPGNLFALLVNLAFILVPALLMNPYEGGITVSAITSGILALQLVLHYDQWNKRFNR